MGLELIETGWVSILPPLIAIVLALVTKEVYSSLFVGISAGMVIYSLASGSSLLAAATRVFQMMTSKIAANGSMIVFLALLWSVVVLVSRSGGSQAYGRWAGNRLKRPRSARLATALLGLLIFIDDGFNCLTVGTVMGPITDKHSISREKLAYLIDATAAPVCIIAPISSWAVAVASELDQTDGFHVFLRTIPYNFYALLTLLMVFFLCLTGWDFGPMAKAEARAAAGSAQADGRKDGGEPCPKGTVADLVLPILVLIVCAVLGMAYVGGFFSGVPFAQAIGADPAGGLTLGAFAGLLTAMVLYLPRRLMSFRSFMDSVIQGVKNIVPPMLILIFSWSLSGVCRELIGTGEFVSRFVASSQLPLGLLPVLVFLIAAFLSFSMGTAWGTFGILIPIVSMICAGGPGADLLVPALGATLAGSVFGDHCSPLSDTTILASTGAQVEHISHVETQLPYAVVVAAVCAVGYLLAGLLRQPWLPLGVCALLLVGLLVLLQLREKRAGTS